MAAGEDQVHFRGSDIAAMIVTLFDARYAQDPGGQSQAGFISRANDDRILKGYSHAVMKLKHGGKDIESCAFDETAPRNVVLIHWTLFFEHGKISCEVET
eukprot:12982149-Heterocapsa_arctica.AAC.1